MDEAEYCDRIGLIYSGPKLAPAPPGPAQAPSTRTVEKKISPKDTGRAYIEMVAEATMEGKPSGNEDERFRKLCARQPACDDDGAHRKGARQPVRSPTSSYPERFSVRWAHPAVFSFRGTESSLERENRPAGAGRSKCDRAPRSPAKIC